MEEILNAECVEILTVELAQAVEQNDIDEVLWQTLICAYLDHAGWRTVAEAVFAAHGYTPEEIRQHTDG